MDFELGTVPRFPWKQRVVFWRTLYRVLAMSFLAAPLGADRRRRHTCVDGVQATAGIAMRKIVSWVWDSSDGRRSQSKFDRSQPFNHFDGAAA